MRISKESVIALKSYEKRSFYRFFTIYISIFLLLFSAVSLLYYYKERNRLFQELKVANKLEYAECRHMNKILGLGDTCEMKIIDKIDGVETIYRDIAIACVVLMLFLLPSGYYLAMMSLRPMRESIETIDSFINGIVHDINTPLSVIKLNAQTLQLRLKEQELQEQNQRILQGIDDIESLEEQLLFSLKAERYVLNTSEFDLHEFLRERQTFYNDVRKTVHVSYAGSVLHVKADKPLMKRMIDNIVLNAIKFSSRDSEVKIQLHGEQLIIEDYGIGMKHPQEVFNKYYREDQDSKGLGLGLYIVASVAALHQLTIDLRSKSQIGTRFVIDLKNIKVI